MSSMLADRHVDSALATGAVEKTKTTWIIEKFNFCRQTSDILTSVPFPQHSNIQWKLTLHPNGQASVHDGWISVYLISLGNTGLMARSSISLADTTRKLEWTPFEKGSIKGWNKFIDKDSVPHKLSSSNSYNLKVFCTIEYYIEQPGENKTRYPRCSPYDNLSKHTRQILTTFNSINESQFTWQIERSKFDQANRLGVKLVSPMYPDNDNFEKHWTLHLSPGGYPNIEYPNGWLTISLQMHDQNECSVKARINLRVNYFSKSLSSLEFRAGQKVGLYNLVNRPSLTERYIGSDYMEICCKIEYCAKRLDSCMVLPKSSNERLSLIDDLSRSLKSGQMADVNIICGSREFKAHKMILASRSPVFNAMFRNSMKEYHTGKIEITDIQPDVFEKLLEFIYTARLDAELLTNASLVELVLAVNKYQLEGLEKRCERLLIDRVDEESAADLLSVAEIFNMHCLKTTATKIIHNI